MLNRDKKSKARITNTKMTKVAVSFSSARAHKGQQQLLLWLNLSQSSPFSALMMFISVVCLEWNNFSGTQM